jgi:hypothetical protein
MPIPKPKGGQEQCKAADKDYKFFPLLVSYILEARITWTLCSWGTASHNKDGDTIPTGSTANFGYCRPNLQWGTAQNHCLVPWQQQQCLACMRMCPINPSTTSRRHAHTSTMEKSSLPENCNWMGPCLSSHDARGWYCSVSAGILLRCYLQEGGGYICSGSHTSKGHAWVNRSCGLFMLAVLRTTASLSKRTFAVLGW